MRHHTLFRGLASCVLVLVLLPQVLVPFPVRATSPVIIGEVAWAGSSLSTSDEWLELWNLGNQDISLVGDTLTGVGQKSISFSSPAIIPAHGTFLISHYAATNTKSILNISPQVVTSTLSLSNTNLLITLTDANGATIDSAGNGGLPPAGLNGTAKATMLRNGNDWTTATSSVNLKPNMTDLGTPGVCDGCMRNLPPPSDEPTSSTSTISNPASTSTSTTDPTTTPASPTSTTTGNLSATTTTSSPEPTSLSSISSTDSSASTSSSVIDIPPDPIVTSPSANDTSTTSIEPAVGTSTSTLPVDTAPTTSSTFSDTVDSFTSSVPPDAPATTSTVSPSILDTGNTASSTNSTIPIVDSATSTTPQEDAPSDSSTSAVTPTLAFPATNPETSTVPVSSVPNYDLLRLNEVMPQPNNEAEWIEITSLDVNTPVALAGCHLRDAVGNIYTFTTGNIDSLQPYLRVSLASSHLNNDGDTVKLIDPNGRIIDTFVYTTSKKGVTWSRIPDAAGAWRLTSIVTPNNANQADPPAIVSTVTATTEDAPSQVTDSSSPALETDEQLSITESPPIEEEIDEINQADITATSSGPVSNSGAATTPTVKHATPSKTQKKTAPKKSLSITQPKTLKTRTAHPAITTSQSKRASAKTIPPPKPISLDMIQQEGKAGIHVILHGIVGSPAELLTSHAFVLLAEDGRGLFVHTQGNQKLPLLGESIKITGTLAFNDEGVPSLKLGKNDQWTTLPGTSTATPRVVDLLAPSIEDDWSLVQVTGTVQSVKGERVILDLEDASIAIVIKSAADYRAARLVPGDVIRITGLIDTISQDPLILPRQANDIELIAHAKKPAAQNNSSPANLPGWMPFGAAGAAVVGTEGARQAKRRLKQRLLEKTLKVRITES